MSRFWYSTADQPGSRRSVEGASLPAILFHLHDQGLTVTGAGEVAAAPVRLPRVRETQLTAVYEQLAALLAQGMELSEALRRLAFETSSPRASRCLGFLAERVSQGVRLSEAMAEQPQVFAEVVTNTVAAGETSGDLVAALRSLADHQRDLLRLGADLALPFAYPVFLLIFVGALLIVTTTFLAVFILPKFLQLYKELGMKEEEFPMVTRWVMGWSSFMVHGGWTLPFVLLVAAVAYYLRQRVSLGQLTVRPLGFPVPLFGKIALSAALARTAATLRLLLLARVPVPQAVRLAGDSSGSPNVRLAMRHAQEALTQGGSLSESLRGSPLLPEPFVFSLAAAETSGTLPPTLAEMEIDYRRAVGLQSRYWLMLAGPLVVVGLGLIIGIVAMGMWMPLVSVLHLLSS
ncbi:MAG TPA: type II secretion system F family protein [Armatimonadota bacterium]|jgi:type II secretory pathway component PulF